MQGVLNGLLCGAFVALFAVASASMGTAAERPNIVFLFADDWGRHAGAYAKLDGPGGVNDAAKTPNFDRLAAQGVLFRHAHVNAPSCTPCRSSILSGQYFWRTGRGAILRGAVWDESIPSYPLLLQQAGYHIGKTYKVWSPGQPADAPYGGQKFAYEKAGRRFNQFSQNATKMVENGETVEEAKNKLYAEVRGNFRDFLAARPAGAPFCYWFGPTNTHRSWTRGSGKALWGIDPDSLRGKMPPYLPDVPEIREDLADYLGEAAAFDASIGVIVDELKKAGEFERTLIVISGDHGAPGFLRGKCNLYDFGTGVALAIVGPGVRGGLVDPSRDFVLTGRERHVDIARADRSPYPQRAIRTAEHVLIINFKPDRWPLGDPYRLDGDLEPTLQELLSNTRVTLPDEDASPTKAWMVLHRNDPQWRAHFDWVYGKRPRYELYDLKRDPHETKNVADDPAYAEVKQSLERRLLAELERTRDPRLIDDGKYFETPPLAGPLPDEATFWGPDNPKPAGQKAGNRQ